MGYVALINSIFGNSLNIEYLEGGFYNSEVSIISRENQKIVKVFNGRPGVPLTLSSAALIGKKITKYRNKLLEVGVSVSPSFDWFIVIDDKTDLPVIVMIEPYCGPNIASLIRKADTSFCLELAGGLLETISPIIQRSLVGPLDVGIDAQPNNFTLADGKYTFVDFTPPRYFDDGAYLIEDPQPKSTLGYNLGHWRYFTAEGILSVLLTQLARIRPRMFGQFKSLLVDWLENNSYEGLASSFREPSVNLDNLYSIVNPVQLRLIMCDLISRNGASVEEVGDFFKLTHFEDELSALTVEVAHEKIMKLYKKVSEV